MALCALQLDFTSGIRVKYKHIDKKKVGLSRVTLESQVNDFFSFYLTPNTLIQWSSDQIDHLPNSTKNIGPCPEFTRVDLTCPYLTFRDLI